MRVIKRICPHHVSNQGCVIFHAGANVARRWADFQQYSEADQKYFDQLLPLESLDFASADELEVEPSPSAIANDERLDVCSQTMVHLEEISLIADDPDALAALRTLQNKGYTSGQVKQAFDELDPVPVTRVAERQAKRCSLDEKVKHWVGKILAKRGVNPKGHELDTVWKIRKQSSIQLANTCPDSY